MATRQNMLKLLSLTVQNARVAAPSILVLVLIINLVIIPLGIGGVPQT